MPLREIERLSYKFHQAELLGDYGVDPDGNSQYAPY